MLFSFINFNSIPFHSQSNFNEEFDVIKDFIDDTNQNEQFSIVCLNEVYGYRSGIFGFCLNYLSNCIKSQPTLIKNYMNSQCYKNNPFVTFLLWIFDDILCEKIMNRVSQY